MLYNLINSTLSPINGDIDLCIEPVSFHNNIISQNSNSISNTNDNSDSNKTSGRKWGDTFQDLVERSKEYIYYA